MSQLPDDVLRPWSAATVGRVELPLAGGPKGNGTGAVCVPWRWEPAGRGPLAAASENGAQQHGSQAQVLAALAAVLARWAQADGLDLGLLAGPPNAPRLAIARVSLAKDLRLAALVARSASTLDALERLPPGEPPIAAELPPAPQGWATVGFASGGSTTADTWGGEAGPWDLTLRIGGASGERVEGTLHAKPGTLARGQLESLVESLLAVLEADRELPLEALPSLPPSVEARLIEWGRGPQSAWPPGETVISLFLSQVERTPDARALEFEGRGLSYRELAGASRGLAQRLLRDGVGPGACVGVVMAPGLEPVIALLGILRAGAAYVPLDPESPPERIRSVLDRARATRVLTQQALRSLVPGELTAYSLDTDLAALTREDASVLPTILPGQLAYVVFTSGSTGEPKGVMVPHGALANHAQAAGARFGLQPDDRVLQFTPLCFDAAGEEIYPPLAVGAAVHVRGELVAANAFRELIERERLTVLSLPPAYLHECLEALERTGQVLPPGLRTLILGGERILPETLARWTRLGGERARIFNVYGPTEATITAVLCELPPDIDWAAREVVDMGVPLANVRGDLVDPATLQRVPPGVVGELILGGRGISWGYLGRPDLTAERFLPDPFATEPGARIYRTGDLARWTSNGVLRFVGRVDGQLKIRGMRVELGEVEAGLRAQPGVRDTVVVARDLGGQKQLVGYVVPVEGSELTPAILRAGLAQTLPLYMVPAAYVSLPALPLTPNGKVDLRALPAPVIASDGLAHDDTPLEAALRTIWGEVLGCVVPSVDADFFELGGHSLAAIQVLSRIEAELAIVLDFEHVLNAPTVRGLAAIIEQVRDTLPALDGDIDGMSDEQVEAMLRQLAQGG